MPKRKIVLSKSFEKAYIKFVNKRPILKTAIQKSIFLLEEDALNKKLKTYKLSGNLYGLFACSCGYDCRIIFSIEINIETKEEEILLIDLGTHDEVY
jgi:mRNA-degrading endonuclease YafQ of YafQ-DinJ toxin-antitoxin module